MPEPAWHYMMAENVLAEGAKTVDRIKGLSIQRQAHAPQNFDTMGMVWSSDADRSKYNHLTKQMDELGIKARGCWEQSTAHALLAGMYGGNIHQRAAELRKSEEDEF